MGLLDIGALPTDDADARLLKRIQVAMAAASVPVIALWGSTFVLMGHPRLAIAPAVYCGGTVTLLVAVALTGWFRLLRVPHLLLVLLGPFALHWQLGGYLGSGGAFLWCLLAPMAAMMFQGVRRSLPWFAAFVVLAIVGLFHDVPSPLTPAQLRIQFAFNAVGFLAFLFLSMRFFVSRLAEERARSDSLLLNVLPAKIADRLKRGETTIAERFSGVTVLFSDIVGFTPTSARLAPQELVALLDEIFSEFDVIADRFGLEKIKTMGDGYMVVAGVPEPHADHAQRTADAALAMRDRLAELAAARKLDLSMRIGIHSGEVVAGVIGRRKFAYDLWGDTVNTASRMESHGSPGRIHVSEATRALLEREFVLEGRGTVNVKGKGELRTFWLEHRRAP
jgi:adenylate cyclase